MTEELFEKYVVPFYGNPDLLADEKAEILIELINSSNFEVILSYFLTFDEWRNRVVASTIIGGIRIEKYIDQIYSQAKEFNEYHQAKSYAFALINMNCKKATDYLEALARAELESEYSKNVQKFYQAGFKIKDDRYEPNIDLCKETHVLNMRIERWENLKY